MIGRFFFFFLTSTEKSLSLSPPSGEQNAKNYINMEKTSDDRIWMYQNLEAAL